ncbi:Chloramphenicol 3-O phosphotransferase [Streptomyces sp. YIM 130001]|uniref:chloramphenicol phosphotransferase CPT n=1 Tax=Streptomyces sp. YIM 130001 TaxID=2259644 RepID=UPI000E64F0CA|nr:chloramphenicol phosphotransferase CPT [Streptomyces sp. YIM 130001]RII20840.1 Chloramphenicol 3-O phosphotransferase [Streptomyces sp. YIM 130001]
MTTRLIILNGGSSSGKTGIVRCLQDVLPDPWLAFGADSFVESMPARMRASDTGIEVGADGTVSVGEEFRVLEAAWRTGIVAMVRAGARVVIDEIFLGGGASQQRWQQVLGDLNALWVGVHCDAQVAAGREIARGNRARGMAELQAQSVHLNVTYDLELDTTHTEPLTSAHTIANHLH